MDSQGTSSKSLDWFCWGNSLIVEKMVHQPGNIGAYSDSFFSGIILENKALYDVNSCRIIELSASSKQQAVSQLRRKSAFTAGKGPVNCLLNIKQCKWLPRKCLKEWGVYVTSQFEKGWWVVFFNLFFHLHLIIWSISNLFQYGNLSVRCFLQYCVNFCWASSTLQKHASSSYRLPPLC